MQKRILLLALIAAAFLQICLGQNQNKIDSLLQLLPSAREDTNKAKVLINLSQLNYPNDPQKCFDYASQALSLSQKLNFSKCIVRSFQNIAIYYYTKGEYQTSFDNCKKAISIVERIGDKEAHCDILNIMSAISSSTGNMDAARDYSLKALSIADSIKDTLRMVKYNTNLGIDYENRSDYLPALSYFFKALKINEALQNKSSMADNYFQIARVYVLQEIDTDKALKYSFLSLEFAKAADNQLQVANSLDLIGSIYTEKKEWNKALNYLEDALNKYQLMGLINETGSTNFNIGEVYREQGKPDKSIKYYLTSLEIGSKIGDPDGIGSGYYGLGLAYQSKKDYRRAIDYLQKGLSNAQAQESPAHARNMVQSLATNYSLIGDYKSAYNYLIEYNRLNDSISNKQIINKSNELREKYESEKKEKEISLLNKDKEIQTIEIKKQKLLKNSFIGGLALTLLLFFFGYRSYRARQVLRLQTIRNRIADDLHDDIGSTLNSISVFSEVAKQKSPAVVQELEQIGEASRKIIDAMSDIVWTINTKNDSFEQIILRLRSLTYNLLRAKNIEHTFRADESLNDMKLSMEQRRNFYLIFKEALNNLVKYSNTTRVSISLTHENNFITLSIRDNGVGFDVKQPSTGNGLLSMKSRAEEMKAELKIESEPGSGTNVELKLRA